MCADAIPHLRESLRLDPKAITLINLAKCEQRIGKLAEALGHWVDARVRARGEGNAAIEEEAEHRARELEPRLPRLIVTLADEAPRGSEVERDGTVLGNASLGTAASVDPGIHVVVVKAPGRKDARFEVRLGEAEKRSIVVNASPADPSSPTEPSTSGTGKRTLVYAGLGVGAVGLAVGAVTGIMAFAKADKLKDLCPQYECENQKLIDENQSSGRTLGIVSTAGFIVAGMGAAVFLVGWFSNSGSDTANASKASFFVSPSAAGFRGSF
jgi:hypothetical protein